MPASESEVLRATYRLDVPPEAVESRAESLRYEQSVEVPPSTLDDPFVKEEILPRLESIEPHASGGFRVELGFSPSTTACDPSQLLNVLFGNCSMLPDVSLLDVELPESLRRSLGGPRHGVAGLRARLGVPERPLTCTAIKPMGLSTTALAELCAVFARGGLDVIKDDHGLADHPFCRFEERVERCQASIERVAGETGHRALYAPNLNGPPERVHAQIEFATRRGVEAFLLSPMLLGLPTLAEIAGAPQPPLLLAHPAFSGGTRIRPWALLGRLFRACGADAVIFPHAGGRFAAYDETTCRGLAERLRGPSPPLRPSLPVPAGGMSVARVEELIRFYGPDAMLLVGGNLYEAGPALLERSRDFVDAVRRAADRPGPWA